MKKILKNVKLEVEWVKKIHADEEWHGHIARSILTGKVYEEPVDYVDINRYSDITVFNETCLDTAIKINERHPDAKIIIHNFADRKNPGGRFLLRKGGGQEEDLCLQSGLAPCLIALKDTCKNMYNDAKGKSIDCLNKTFSPIIYNKAIPISRTLGSLEDYFVADFISASPIKVRRHKVTDYFNYYDTVDNKVKSLLNIVLKESDEETYFITGAWGCKGDDIIPINVFSKYLECANKVKRNTGNNVHMVFAIPDIDIYKIAIETFGVYNVLN